jgi:hypothetical protein
VSEPVERFLERIGIDINSNEFTVFSAILEASGEPRNPTTYKEMRPYLDRASDKPLTKQYVYKCLRNLEEQGLVQVIPLRPKKFIVSEGELGKALREMAGTKTDALNKEKIGIGQQLEALGHANVEEAAILLAGELMGVPYSVGSIMIEGIQNVRAAVVREFAECSRKGDTVRVLAYVSTMAEGLGPGGFAEASLLQAALKGTHVIGVLIPHTKDESDFELMARHLSTLTGMVGKVLKTGNIGLRISSQVVRTYRMVSLNDEKMLLYLTHAKESDIAALVFRKDNPGLIDDAIRTFDTLWDKGIDVLKIVTERAGITRGT